MSCCYRNDNKADNFPLRAHPPSFISYTQHKFAGNSLTTLFILSLEVNKTKPCSLSCHFETIKKCKLLCSEDIGKLKVISLPLTDCYKALTLDTSSITIDVECLH